MPKAAIRKLVEEVEELAEQTRTRREVRVSGDAYAALSAWSRDVLAEDGYSCQGEVPPHVLEAILRARVETLRPRGTRHWVIVQAVDLPALYHASDQARSHPTCEHLQRRALGRLMDYLAGMMDPAVAPPRVEVEGDDGPMLSVLREEGDEYLEVAALRDRRVVTAAAFVVGEYAVRLVLTGGKLRPDDPDSELHGGAEPLVQWWDRRALLPPDMGPPGCPLCATMKVSDVLEWTTGRPLNAWVPRWKVDWHAHVVEAQNRLRFRLADLATLPARTRAWVDSRPQE